MARPLETVVRDMLGDQALKIAQLIAENEALKTANAANTAALQAALAVPVAPKKGK